MKKKSQKFLRPAPWLPLRLPARIFCCFTIQTATPTRGTEKRSLITQQESNPDLSLRNTTSVAKLWANTKKLLRIRCHIY